MTREEAATVLENALVCCGNAPVEATFEAGCDEVCDALQLAISALRKQDSRIESDTVKNGWISVKERLPKEFVSVLVYMPEEWPLPTVHEGFLAREGVWYANHFDREPMEITHWMPLPEAPKEV